MAAILADDICRDCRRSSDEVIPRQVSATTQIRLCAECAEERRRLDPPPYLGGEEADDDV